MSGADSLSGEAAFKNNSGQWLSRTMFIDFKDYVSAQGYVPNFKYTLRNEDYKGYPSLKRLYLESNDPSEYSFALSHLGSWDHWLALCDMSFMADIVPQWREELRIKLQSEAIAKMQAIARDPTHKNYYIANKFLTEEGWNVETKRLRQGRKSKETVATEAKKQAKETFTRSRDFEEDYSRLFPSVKQ